jgi:predicted kinase
MRNWMRERLKRRKKAQENAGSKPAPLQPAYFESKPEAAQGATEEAAPASETAVEAGPEAQATDRSSEETSENAKTASGETGARRPRRRRGRGGRGRRRPAQPAPAPESTEPAPGIPAPAPAAPPIVAPAASSKGLVVLAIGLPGSGKSSWFKRHNITPLSSDMVRQMLFDDASEQRFQDLVFSNLRSMLRARLIARRPMNYLDATNLTPHDRQSWIKLAKDFGYDIQAVYFDVPLEVCLERNQKRHRVVTEDVMRKMAGKLKPPSFDEGFTKITVVRVKPKQD